MAALATDEGPRLGLPEVTPEEFSLLRSATPEGLALANACIVAGMLEAEHQFLLPTPAARGFRLRA